MRIIGPKRWQSSATLPYRAKNMTTTTLGEEIYRAMFENAGVGITRVDLKGALVDANQTTCNMVGYTEILCSAGL